MKRAIYYSFSTLFIVFSVLLLNTSFGELVLGSKSTILNININDAIDTNLGNDSTISNPLREGAYQVVHSDDGNHTIGGIVNDEEISTHEKAMNRVLKIIKNIINRALGMLGLIALVYIVLHGFIILTAAGDDTKYKKGIKGIKNGIIAIVGIGLSRFIISFIIRIIENVAK